MGAKLEFIKRIDSKVEGICVNTLRSLVAFNLNAKDPVETISEDVDMAEEGGVLITSKGVRNDIGEFHGVVRRIKLGQLDRRNRVLNKEARKETTAMNNQDKKDVKRAVRSMEEQERETNPNKIAGSIGKANRDLDSIISNLKDKNVMKIVDQTGSFLKKRIKQLQEGHEEQGSGTPEPPIEEEEDLDTYLDRIIALPPSDEGMKMSKGLKPYLDKLMVKNKVGIDQQDVDKVLRIVESNPIDYKAIVMLCPDKATECPHNNCPFKEIEKIPSTSPCPIELVYVDKLLREYMREILLDEDDMVGLIEYNMIVGVVDADVVDFRLRGMMTQLGYLIDDISVNPRTGKEILNRKVNPLIELMKVNEKRKSNALRELLATPEIRERLNIKKTHTKEKTNMEKTTKDKKVAALLEKVRAHKSLAIDFEKEEKGKSE